MANRYELSAPLENRGKNKDQCFWVNRIGVMFPLKSGDGFSILLDAVPTPGPDGQIKIIARPPREKDGGGSSSGGDYDGY